ncbi:MAG: LysM peptidoglycan-binding domain-containing protein, partial [Spirochaetaceae bacterium]|nr:LysM peptidoglycan-binding domain-containing protein [Spirochaetaceae bacterium]
MLLIFFVSPLLFAQYPEIEQTDIFRDENFKELQQDIQRLYPRLIHWENGQQTEELTEELLSNLKFYQYTVKEGEDLFIIAADMVLNIDSLSSLNGIENPLFLQTGTVLIIPNMPGIYLSKEIRN